MPGVDLNYFLRQANKLTEKIEQAYTVKKEKEIMDVYFTSFVQDGHLHFGNDLYDRDSKLVAQMKAATKSTETNAAQDSLRMMAKQS